MKRTLWPLLLGIVVLVGCSETTDKPATSGAATGGAANTATANDDTDLGSAETADAANDAAAENTTDNASNVEAADGDATADNSAAYGAAARAAAATTIALTPGNTKIEFVGVHTDATKEDRKGGFKTFTGTAEVEGGALASVAIDIETGSLWTEFDMLTTHLNTPDFFDTRQHPTARFESTRIEVGTGSEATITGNLTLLGTTKEISFPATIAWSDSGPTIGAEFTIDRTEFGMDKMLEGVKPDVTITVTVGEQAAE